MPRQLTIIRDANRKAWRLFWYAGPCIRAAVLGSPAAPKLYEPILFTQDELACLVERGDITTVSSDEWANLDEQTRRHAETTRTLTGHIYRPSFATVEQIEAGYALHRDVAARGIRNPYGFANAVLRFSGSDARRIEHFRTLRPAQIAEVRLALADPDRFGVRLSDFQRTPSRRRFTSAATA